MSVAMTAVELVVECRKIANVAFSNPTDLVSDGQVTRYGVDDRVWMCLVGRRYHEL